MLRPTRIKQFLRQIYAFPLIRITPPTSSRNVNLMMIAQHVSYKSQRKSHTRNEKKEFSMSPPRAQPKTKQERSKREKEILAHREIAQRNNYPFFTSRRPTYSRGKYVSFPLFHVLERDILIACPRMMIVG